MENFVPLSKAIMMDTVATLDIPMENDVFVICESFNNVFAELTGAYSRCLFWERAKPEKEWDKQKIEQWKKRFSEIFLLRNSYEHVGWMEKSEIIELYCTELKEILADGRQLRENIKGTGNE